MDQIDILSGLKPDSELYTVRRERPDFVEGAELCRETVLAPNHDFGIGHAMRAAFAARMARFIGREDLARAYDLLLEEAGGDDALAAIASAAAQPANATAFTQALVRHVDLVTERPRDNTRADIGRLEAAGLTNPQIVALSELIAFVNFEARVIVGLRVLNEVA
ncbi:CMD domain-containing protein [Rhizobium puerariae]|uniref:CMD domain-containing protein n=1 Tax=Rhizobium puerariae TaxID=1585791 RepID=A0ABV6ADK3_9HYPH